MLFVHAEWGTRSSLRFLNDNIVFSKDGKVVNRASCHKVFAVFIMGDMMITSRLLQKAGTHAISLFFLRNNFEVFAPFAAKAEGNYLLRMKQYGLSEDEEFSIAKHIVANKIENQNRLLLSRKKGADKEEMEQMRERIKNALNGQELLGIEGEYSRKFFSGYFSEINWWKRMPRVKPDVSNFLLDMGYTYLFNFVDALLRLHGFDTYKGVYHKLFFQRKSLACDIVEPFRCIIDRQLLKAYNLKQVHEGDFDIVHKKVTLPFDKQKKYTSLFLQVIMDQKEEIFSYVHEYYRHMMDTKNDMPKFNIKTK